MKELVLAMAVLILIVNIGCTMDQKRMCEKLEALKISIPPGTILVGKNGEIAELACVSSDVDHSLYLSIPDVGNLYGPEVEGWPSRERRYLLLLHKAGRRAPPNWDSRENIWVVYSTSESELGKDIQ